MHPFLQTLVNEPDLPPDLAQNLDTNEFVFAIGPYSGSELPPVAQADVSVASTAPGRPKQSKLGLAPPRWNRRPMDSFLQTLVDEPHLPPDLAHDLDTNSGSELPRVAPGLRLGWQNHHPCAQ